MRPARHKATGFVTRTNRASPSAAAAAVEPAIGKPATARSAGRAVAICVDPGHALEWTQRIASRGPARGPPLRMGTAGRVWPTVSLDPVIATG
jgi:hypothetical protein